jgi:hypothetical protein
MSIVSIIFFINFMGVFKVLGIYNLSARPYASSEWLAEIGLYVIRTELDAGSLLIDILEGEKQN